MSCHADNPALSPHRLEESLATKVELEDEFDLCAQAANLLQPHHALVGQVLHQLVYGRVKLPVQLVLADAIVELLPGTQLAAPVT